GRALARVGRNKAPVLAGNVPEPVFLTQATWANALGQPVVARWGAVSGLPHTPDVTALVAALESAGVRERSINPGLSSATVEAVQALAPDAVHAARDDIHVRRR